MFKVHGHAENSILKVISVREGSAKEGNIKMLFTIKSRDYMLTKIFLLYIWYVKKHQNTGPQTCMGNS